MVGYQYVRHLIVVRRAMTCKPVRVAVGQVSSNQAEKGQAGTPDGAKPGAEASSPNHYHHFSR